MQSYIKQAELKKQAMWKLLEGGVNAYAKNAGDSSVKNPVMKTISIGIFSPFSKCS